jgi:purine-binding chemotaxis protein CheW
MMEPNVSPKKANGPAASGEATTSAYLTFEVGPDTYGVPILKIREILQFETVTRVPGTPPSIRGVMNLRGSVIAVVDLGVKFGLGQTDATNRTCVVIVEVTLDDEQTVMGVMADAVREVLELRPEDLQPPPLFGTRVRVDYLKGMSRYGQGFMLLLDIDRLLSAEELAIAAQARHSIHLLEGPEDAEEPAPKKRARKSRPKNQPPSSESADLDQAWDAQRK